MAGRKRNTGFQTILSIVIAAVFVGMGWLLEKDRTGQSSPMKSGETAIPASVDVKKDALVWYLDVGQGDSELIQIPKENKKEYTNILIDAGTRATADRLVQRLNAMQVKKIDILIATHPHEDHIGGMAKVIRSFPVGTCYMPKISRAKTPTTKTYEHLLDALEDKHVKTLPGKAGMTVLKQGEATLSFLAPAGVQYDNLNNYSVVAKLVYGKERFMFNGDAEAKSEKEMLAGKRDVACDVLKLGHHGSSTSTTAAFLKKASPKAAIVSCGVNNDYGHPHKETLKKLEKAHVTVYRTDKQGSILAVCNGKSVTFKTGLPSVIPK